MWECEIKLRKERANSLLVSNICNKLGCLVLYLKVIGKEYDMTLI